MADVPLTAYLREWCRHRFSWARHNCGHFVVGWLAVNGVTIDDDLLGTFTTPKGWRRALRRRGFDGLVELADHRLAPTAWARRTGPARCGDLVVVRDPGGRELFGVSLGDAVVMPAERGLVSTRGATVLAAWGP